MITERDSFSLLNFMFHFCRNVQRPWKLTHVMKNSQMNQKTVWRPLDPSDVVPVQTEDENHMETLLGPTDDVQVHNEAENCRETTRSSGKGWHWNRIYPRGEFTPQQIRYTGEEKILSSYLDLLQLKSSPDCTSLSKLLIMLLLKQICMQGSTLKQKRTTSGLILQLTNGNQLKGLIC